MFTQTLQHLRHNLNILQEREARYAGDAPTALLNQIDDHIAAITLTGQAQRREISEAEWRESLRPLLVEIRERSEQQPDSCGVTLGDVDGSLIGAIMAGRDISAGGDIVTGAKGQLSAQGEGIAQVIGSGAATVNVTHIHGQPYRPPLMRPPRAKHFTDRTDELAALLAQVQPGRVVTLCGPGGIGKTALAAEAIHRLAPDETPPGRFPDGLYFYSFYNQPQAAVALEDIALAFGEEAKPTPRAAARRALANRRALLLLDGAEDADNLPPVLDVAGQCGVIITSRKRSDAPDDFTDLAPLPPAEAVALLRRWANRQTITGSDAHALCALVGHLPLAVRLAGRYLARSGDSAADYLEWLQSTPLEALNQGQRRHDSVPLLLARCLAQVSQTAREILAAAGLLALAPFDRATMAAALRQTTAAALRQPLGELLNYGLLLRQGPRYVVSHALVLTYARRLARPPTLLPQLLAYFTALAKQQDAQGRTGYERLDAERRHLLELLNRCPPDQVDAALGLLDAINNNLRFRGYTAEWQLALERGLHLATAADNQAGQARCIEYLGDVHLRLAEYEAARARYEEARPIYHAIGDRLGEANCIRALGDVHYMLAEYQAARARYEEARPIYHAIGDRLGEANCIRALGDVHRMLAEYEAARARYEEARPIYHAIGDRLGEANCIRSLGLLQRDKQNWPQAQSYFQEALDIYQAIHSAYDIAWSHYLLGLTLAHQDSPTTTAQHHYQSALELFETIGLQPQVDMVQQALTELPA